MELIVESPVRTIETNVHTTEVVLAAASKKKKPVFVASTSEVYGKSTALPFQEDGDLLLGPTFKGRWSLRLLQGDRRVPRARLLEGARPAHRHRPHVQHRRPAPDRPLRHGGPELRAPGDRRPALTVFGDGTQSRCFCHVHDVVRALAGLMERDDLYGQVFNIGSESEITIRALAAGCGSSWARRPRSPTCPTSEAYEEGFEDMQRRVPDISKISAVLGWEPTRTLDQIVLDVRDQQLQSSRLSAVAA